MCARMGCGPCPAMQAATTASVPVPVAPGKLVQLGTMIPQYAGLTLRGNLYGTDQSRDREAGIGDHDQIDRSLFCHGSHALRSVWEFRRLILALVTLTVAKHSTQSPSRSSRQVTTCVMGTAVIRPTQSDSIPSDSARRLR